MQDATLELVASSLVSSDLRHRLGKTGEQIAASHLVARGFAILARNHRTRWGEIDLIACDRERIVFCEVKTRRLGSTGPLESLHETQCVRLRRMAAAWLHDERNRPQVPELRFDAIGVTIDAHGKLVALEHLEGAF